MQNYQRIDATIVMRTESILTQLVLQHALRIRMVADTSGQARSSSSGINTPVVSEGTGKTDTQASTFSSELNGTQPDTIESGSDSGSTAQESEGSPIVLSPSTKASAASKSLVGRMNNLITTDLQALGRSTDVFQVLVAVPVGIIGSTVFLYNILGWR